MSDEGVYDHLLARVSRMYPTDPEHARSSVLFPGVPAAPVPAPSVYAVEVYRGPNFALYRLRNGGLQLMGDEDYCEIDFTVEIATAVRDALDTWIKEQ